MDRFGGVFLAEHARRFIGSEIQLGQLLDLEFKKVERLAHQSAFDQLVGHDSADAFNIECAAGREEFHAPRRLGRALKIFASPGDELRIAPDRAAADRTFAVNMLRKNRTASRSRGRFDFTTSTTAGITSPAFSITTVSPMPDVFALDLIFVVQRRA